MYVQYGLGDVLNVGGCRSCSVLRVRYGTADMMMVAFVVFCRVLQCIAVCCSVSLLHKIYCFIKFAVLQNLLVESVRYGTADTSNVAPAVCRSVLQCCCSYSVLQCVAVRCSVIHVRYGAAHTSNIHIHRCVEAGYVVLQCIWRTGVL